MASKFIMVVGVDLAQFEGAAPLSHHECIEALTIAPLAYLVRACKAVSLPTVRLPAESYSLLGRVAHTHRCTSMCRGDLSC